VHLKAMLKEMAPCHHHLRMENPGFTFNLGMCFVYKKKKARVGVKRGGVRSPQKHVARLPKGRRGAVTIT